VSGFWEYAWGTHQDSVLADSVQIASRLSEAGFALEREPGRLRFRHVQFGLGYADLRLDFDSHGALWHGVVRVEADSRQADSIRASWRKHHGRESREGRIDTDSGYTTFWSTGSTVDRHYFARRAASPDRLEIRALDLFYGGCLSGCPLYSVRLLADGTALFHSIREVEPLGGFSGEWAPDHFALFEAATTDTAFLTLEPSYSPTLQRGLASRGLQVYYSNGASVSAVSVQQSGPPVLEHLIETLDSIASGVVWVRPLVLWDTLDLQAQRWVDLDSLEQLARHSDVVPPYVP
jgi:hypothetical protein